MYQLAKDYLNKKEQELVRGYWESINNIEIGLDKQYQEYLKGVSEYILSFISLSKKAFAMDVRVAFAGSIELARTIGVPFDEILDSKEKIDNYFLQ